MGYCGNIPCFRYRVAYPERFHQQCETAYISLFFTLKETEVEMMLG